LISYKILNGSWERENLTLLIERVSVETMDHEMVSYDEPKVMATCSIGYHRVNNEILHERDSERVNGFIRVKFKIPLCIAQKASDSYDKCKDDLKQSIMPTTHRDVPEHWLSTEVKNGMDLMFDITKFQQVFNPHQVDLGQELLYKFHGLDPHVRDQLRDFNNTVTGFQSWVEKARCDGERYAKKHKKDEDEHLTPLDIRRRAEAAHHKMLNPSKNPHNKTPVDQVFSLEELG
jgi:hypothetical protein